MKRPQIEVTEKEEKSLAFKAIVLGLAFFWPLLILFLAVIIRPII